MKTATPANRLAAETSPYLLQHAHNPVDWYPWCEEALQKARAEDKPILLSIGYSACHWCHVMAHESFEDAETAALMNRLFVNIKVDREERPDLDKIYQLAHQAMVRRGGGWPLTVFLDPHNQAPFFAGTYFPPEPRHGLPPFRHVLKSVADYYHGQKSDLAANGEALIGFFRSLEHQGAAGQLDGSSLNAAQSALAEDYDTEHGGFGGAPKFPQPSTVEFLLRRGADDPEAYSMACCSLRAMAESGLCDHLGGGFFRYCVDGQWEIPHFEKMLYDNGALLALYAKAYASGGEDVFRRAARATARWLQVDMQSPQGGYYAARDADSEGDEGKYYLWTPAEAQALLPPESWAEARHCYGLDRPANFEGHWHLRRRQEPSDPALLELARVRLLAARRERPPPGLDGKILTAWNALAIRGMALAGRCLDDADCLESARRAADFLYENLWRDGRLYACHTDGRTRFPAYLDDHAFLLDALLELLQASWESAWLNWAVELAEQLLDRFEDREQGGFHFTAHDHEALLLRPKPFMDESIPSGNGIAALALGRLGHLLAEPRYLNAAERTLKAAAPSMNRYPAGHAALLTALDDWFHPPTIIILRGEAQAMAAWIGTLPWNPRRLCFAIPADAADLPPALAERRPETGVVAYVCRAGVCQAPLRAPDALLGALPTGAWP